jgi:hypothetical protein
VVAVATQHLESLRETAALQVEVHPPSRRQLRDTGYSLSLDLPSMFGTVVLDVVEDEESKVCFAATSASW